MGLIQKPITSKFLIENKHISGSEIAMVLINTQNVNAHLNDNLLLIAGQYISRFHVCLFCFVLTGTYLQ